MNPAFNALVDNLKRLPGLGYRSAERIALHLLVESPESTESLQTTLAKASETLSRCPITGNITDSDTCAIYADNTRDRSVISVVEHVPDLLALERSGAFRGTYHVLHGRLSPIHGIGPENINLESLEKRLESDSVTELILALPNDIESEATCHYIQEEVVGEREITVSRIGFGLPSSRGIDLADPATLRNAMTGRRVVEAGNDSL
ncbi:MAG: recombination mediator RecR [Opitutales bacterium]